MYLQTALLTNLSFSHERSYFMTVAGREAHSDMKKKHVIFTCVWSRLAIIFLKENFAKVPISECLGELLTLVLFYFWGEIALN